MITVEGGFDLNYRALKALGSSLAPSFKANLHTPSAFAPFSPLASTGKFQRIEHSASFTVFPKPALRDRQVKELYHCELVLPPGELAKK